MNLAVTRRAVRAIEPDVIGANYSVGRYRLWCVVKYAEPGKPVIGRGVTQYRAWLDALANLSKPRLYTEDSSDGQQHEVR